MSSRTFTRSRSRVMSSPAPPNNRAPLFGKSVQLPPRRIHPRDPAPPTFRSADARLSPVVRPNHATRRSRRQAPIPRCRPTRRTGADARLSASGQSRSECWIHDPGDVRPLSPAEVRLSASGQSRSECWIRDPGDVRPSPRRGSPECIRAVAWRLLDSRPRRCSPISTPSCPGEQ